MPASKGDVNMIKMTVKLKDDNYMPKVDTAFVELAKMNKVGEGIYESDEDVMRISYLAAKELMKRDWFRENALSMIWEVDDEGEDDLLELFNETIRTQGCLL